MPNKKSKMKKFIITFTDTIEAETKEQALETMLNWMDVDMDNKIELFDFEEVDGEVAQRQRQWT